MENNQVTPFVGVWIETSSQQERGEEAAVTPFVGVWIETVRIIISYYSMTSHPSWVCGLKL